MLNSDGRMNREQNQEEKLWQLARSSSGSQSVSDWRIEDKCGDTWAHEGREDGSWSSCQAHSLIYPISFRSLTAKDSVRNKGRSNWNTQPCQTDRSENMIASSLFTLTWASPGDSDGKESACNAGEQGSIPRLGWFPGEGKSNPFQYSCLENFMDRGAWQATVHGVAKSWTWLSN